MAAASITLLERIWSTRAVLSPWMSWALMRGLAIATAATVGALGAGVVAAVTAIVALGAGAGAAPGAGLAAMFEAGLVAARPGEEVIFCATLAAARLMAGAVLGAALVAFRLNKDAFAAPWTGPPSRYFLRRSTEALSSPGAM